jgi:hypothetical protein
MRAVHWRRVGDELLGGASLLPAESVAGEESAGAPTLQRLLSLGLHEGDLLGRFSDLVAEAQAEHAQAQAARRESALQLSKGGSPQRSRHTSRDSFASPQARSRHQSRDGFASPKSRSRNQSCDDFGQRGLPPSREGRSAIPESPSTEGEAAAGASIVLPESST